MADRYLDFAGLVERLVPLVAELLATLASRDPLRMSFAAIAEKTVLDIVESLRADGMSQEAIAAALDLTINGFRSKMKRLGEVYRDGGVDDAGQRAPTLLERVFTFVDEAGPGGAPVTLRAVEARFRGVKRDTMAGVLHHLVQYGVLSVTGRGLEREYRTVERPRAGASPTIDASVMLYRQGPLSVIELARGLGVSEGIAQGLVDHLREQQSLRETIEPDGTRRFKAVRYHIPIGTREGFEAALWDHLRVVVRAITKKVRAARYGSLADDRTGGTTFSFHLPVGHPLHDEVSGFLARTREEMERWLMAAKALEGARDPDLHWQEITIYTGQVVDDLPLPEDA